MYSLDTISEIHFEISSHCNSKCPQCPRYDMAGRLQKDLNVTHLDTNIISKLPLAKMKNLKSVVLCGNFGDPLMHPELDKILEFFKNQNIMISTNASLRSRDWWANLGSDKNIQVVFCIDGIGLTHELYRRNTNYKKIIQNAEAFISAGGKARWQFIVFRHNEHQVAQARKLSEDMGFVGIDFEYSDRFDVDNRWKVYDDGKYQYDLEKASQQTTLRESLNAVEGEKYWKSMFEKRGTITCEWSKRNKIYIHSDGIVYPCCMLAGVQAGKQIEKLLLKKLVKDSANIDLHNQMLDDVLASETFKKTLPASFKGDPFTHPVCIEWCNKNTGKTHFDRSVPSNKH